MCLGEGGATAGLFGIASVLLLLLLYVMQYQTVFPPPLAPYALWGGVALTCLLPRRVLSPRVEGFARAALLPSSVSV